MAPSMGEKQNEEKINNNNIEFFLHFPMTSANYHIYIILHYDLLTIVNL